MKGLLKIGVVVAIGYLVIQGIDVAKAYASRFHYSIAGYGKPSFSNWVLQLPIVVNVHNPAPISVTADRVIADLFILKNNAWVPVARVDQSITIPPGDTRQTIIAHGNIANIFGGNVFSTFKAFSEALNNQLPLRTEVTVIAQGISLPKQTYDETLRIS